MFSEQNWQHYIRFTFTKSRSLHTISTGPNVFRSICCLRPTMRSSRIVRPIMTCWNFLAFFLTFLSSAIFKDYIINIITSIRALCKAIVYNSREKIDKKNWHLNLLNFCNMWIFAVLWHLLLNMPLQWKTHLTQSHDKN